MSGVEMKLQISDLVRETLELRGVREEDVSAVIRDAEEKGEKAYKGDRYMANLRIGEATFHVEYSLGTGGIYLVHTAYVHKAMMTMGQ